MRRRHLLLALVAWSLALVAPLASAACYLIYNPGNELVWRATTPPVAMDRGALADAVQQRVPGGHLVISNSGAACLPLDLTAPRQTLRQKAAQSHGE